jgi:O-antigen/teichoic acid export membrane protein
VSETVSIFQSIKHLFKHSAVYGIGHIVTRSIHFLLLPFYTHILSPDAYGVVGLMFTYIAILTTFYTYGLDAAFFRFHIMEGDPEERKKIFSTSFYTLSVTSLVFTVVIFALSGPLSRLFFSQEVENLNFPLATLIQWAAGILLFDSISFLPFLVLRAEERSREFVYYKLINVALNVVANVVLVGILKWGLRGIFIANFLASMVTFFILFRILFRYLARTFSKKRLRELLLFGLPYMPLNLSFVVMDTIDRPFLERLSGIREAGLYNAGVKLGMFMALFVAAFRYAWSPFFLSTAGKPQAKQIFSKVLTYLVMACAFLFLLISLFIDEIARFSVLGYSLVGEAYWECTSVVPLIMLAFIFYAVYNNFLVGIYLEKKTAYLPIITAAGMAGNLFLNWQLIPGWHMMGAALARVGAYLIMAVSLYWISKRLYPVKYEWARIVKISAVTALLFWVGNHPQVSPYPGLKGVLLLVWPLLLAAAGFFQKEEVIHLKRILNLTRIFKRKR